MTIFDPAARLLRLSFHRDQHRIPAGRRINDLQALAQEIADSTATDLPLELTGADRVTVAMLLPNHPDPSRVLLDIVGEIHAGQQHELDDDHNQADPEQAAIHYGCAQTLARDAVLAEVEAGAGR